MTAPRKPMEKIDMAAMHLCMELQPSRVLRALEEIGGQPITDRDYWELVLTPETRNVYRRAARVVLQMTSSDQPGLSEEELSLHVEAQREAARLLDF